jgi:Nickel/cobalt transporter regulator
MQLRSLFLATAMAVASLGATAAQAQYYQPGPPPGYYHHHYWHHGDFYHGPRYVVRHWEVYHLPPPPYGFMWVRADHQFLLIGGNGFVARVWGP